MKADLVRYALAAVLCCVAAVAQASFIIPVDNDGFDDGPWTPHPNFSFGPGTTTASTSVLSAHFPWTTPTVAGLPASDSIFGGDAVADPDTYQFSYTPGTDGDNGVIAAGTALNDDGDRAFGRAAGSRGRYRIFATWPQTGNVSGGTDGGTPGNVLYAISDGVGDLASVVIDQNEDGPINGSPGADGNFKGGEWQFLFEVFLDANTTYTLRQQPTTNNSFVSMRAGGVLFEAIPEPASLLMTLAGAGCLAAIRRRR